jgi:tetratricopeptide (TPR) repeat protein
MDIGEWGKPTTNVCAGRYLKPAAEIPLMRNNGECVMSMADETPAQRLERHKLLREDPEKYVENMNLWIEQHPHDYSAFFKRHHGWDRLGEWEKAIADIDVANELRPHPAHYVCRGNILAKMDRHREALMDYATAETLSSPSEWVDCWGPLFQADSHARLGHEQDALAACDRLKDDHWTPGLNDAPGGNKQEVIDEIRNRLAAAKRGPR